MGRKRTKTRRLERAKAQNLPIFFCDKCRYATTEIKAFSNHKADAHGPNAKGKRRKRMAHQSDPSTAHKNWVDRQRAWLNGRNPSPANANQTNRDQPVMVVDFISPDLALKCDLCHKPGALPLTGICVGCDPVLFDNDEPPAKGNINTPDLSKSTPLANGMREPTGNYTGYELWDFKRTVDGLEFLFCGPIELQDDDMDVPPPDEAAITIEGEGIGQIEQGVDIGAEAYRKFTAQLTLPVGAHNNVLLLPRPSATGPTSEVPAPAGVSDAGFGLDDSGEPIIPEFLRRPQDVSQETHDRLTK